jgi:hypothetical protein
MGDGIAHTLNGKLLKSGQYKNQNAVKQYQKGRGLVQYMIIPDKSLRARFEHFAISILRPQFND